ncbi:UDP-N-acetylglucosamine--LPS N-acetylglucosamine transferase [Homoserinibacter sp. YIM 151385]|uniref:UDP-N-acetylglucosamine--LPS N-acetylglucosamine transferase n=1 Tax=Homoserinibacter sp. YIM 151385 TaxID=2985506 RepID=UPI0022EFF8E4|nr:UDP-N-acetylglucosamine--LPS N-acetylglucosamine transferase [Homoserinibacter sp. YIM 151385]WBU38834.1 UDP-N-acetylglucosamine--LPS N-acetylglucosamine transferase [Homoserinibacter sp. YIM 151385]
MRVLIVCSSGGHLTQALALRPWWGAHERRWVTFPVEDARSRLAEEDVVECHYPTVRNLPNLIRNVGLARRVLREFRPDIVLSTGAAIALPFFAQARRHGAATVYIEPVDRIARPSLSGRLTYPFADRFLVQWPQLREHYPGAEDVGMIL